MSAFAQMPRAPSSHRLRRAVSRVNILEEVEELRGEW